MRWEARDLQLFYQSKEYVDTLCIPLIPIQLNAESTASKLAYQKQTLEVLVNELERHFTGRLMLAPIYTYIYETDYDSESNRLKEWTSQLAGDSFHHVFLITNDVNWKKQEHHLGGNVIWLTSPSIDDINSEQMKQFIKDQSSQISELIQSYW